MTRDEFYAGLMVDGLTLNPTEVGGLVSLTWDTATKAERERAATVAVVQRDRFCKAGTREYQRATWIAESIRNG